MVEYIIWGVPENVKVETLLMEKFDGQPITDIETAKRLVKILEIKFKCSKVRIQKIDLTDGFIGSFIKALQT